MHHCGGPHLAAPHPLGGEGGEGGEGGAGGAGGEGGEGGPRVRLARVLLEAGASVDAADADGRSALWLAVRARQAGLLAALLAGGASPSREDGGGVPPLW